MEPTGSKVAVTGTRVSTEPMWWWSRISRISACSIPFTLWPSSAWSTRITRRRGGETMSERVTSPTGPLGPVQGDGGSVVQLLDLLGDVIDQEVRGDGERIGVHQRAAGSGQRDHAPGDVGVQRRDGDGRALLPGQRERGVVRPGGVGGDEQAGPELEGERLCARPIADDDHVALEMPLGLELSIEWTQTRPDSWRSSPASSSAWSTVDDRRQVGGRLLQRRGGA